MLEARQRMIDTQPHLPGLLAASGSDTAIWAAVLRQVPAEKTKMDAFLEETVGTCFGWQDPKLLDLSPLQQTTSSELCVQFGVLVPGWPRERACSSARAAVTKYHGWSGVNN